MVVIPLGHGGGVITGPEGDTNFAVLFEVPKPAVEKAKQLGKEAGSIYLMETLPYWLVDLGTQTASWLCGGTGTVTPESSHKMISNIQGIIFTHAHSDHMGGLPVMLWRFIFVEKTKPLIAVHYELEKDLRRITDEVRYWNGAQLTKLLPTDSGTPLYKERFRPELEHFLNLRFYTTETEEPLENGVFVEFIRVDHNIDGVPAFGVKLRRFNDLPHLVFSGDTCRPLPEEILLDPLNLIFHDCQMYSRDRKTAVHCHLEWLDDAVPETEHHRVYLVHTRTEPNPDLKFPWATKHNPIFI